MNLSHIAIVLLAAMIFVLSAMTGVLYWRQQVLSRTLESVLLALRDHLAPSSPPAAPEDDRASVEQEPEPEDAPAPETTAEVELVEAPPADAPKTAKQLRELLTAKGVPFDKRTTKQELLDLLKATE
jgi:hypothetical protein